MGLKTIVIDNQTTLKQENGQTKLDLVVYPLDEENNLEPYQQLSVYVNNELLGTLTSDADGEVKQTLQLTDKPGSEGIKLRISDEISGVQSKIKYVLLNSQSSNQSTNQVNDSVREEEKRKYIAQVKLNPYNIQHLSERAKADKDIVKIALGQNFGMFAYISDTLKVDENFVCECLEQFGEGLLAYIPNYMKLQDSVKNIIDGYEKNRIEESNKRRIQMEQAEQERRQKLKGDYINKIKQFARNIWSFESWVWEDKDIVLTFINNNDSNYDLDEYYRRISSNLRKDQDVVLLLSNKSPDILGNMLYQNSGYRNMMGDLGTNKDFIISLFRSQGKSIHDIFRIIPMRVMSDALSVDENFIVYCIQSIPNLSADLKTHPYYLSEYLRKSSRIKTIIGYTE